MAKNLLTALQVKQAKPKEKEYLLGDGGNLFVRIRPNGSKYFEVIVRINSKKRRISLGDATIISLEQARKLCEKELIRLKGLPKGMENKIDFDTASNDFLEIKQKQWSQDHYKKALIYFKIFIEYFGKMEVGKINKSDILRSLAKYEKEQKRASFVKATNILKVFFAWAIEKNFCEYNPASTINTFALFGKSKEAHHPHLNDLPKVIALKNSIVNYWGSYQLRLCALLQLYTAERPSEARLATWDEFDLDKGVWTIPAERNNVDKKGKTGISMEISLSSQILKAMREWADMSAELKGFVFKSPKSSLRPLNEASGVGMLKNLGYNTSNVIDMHGFRGTFSTIANELYDEHGFAPHIIDSCLGHKQKDKIEAAYNHASFKTQKAKLLQWWGDKLGEI